jgi:hypothetical protein
MQLLDMISSAEALGTAEDCFCILDQNSDSSVHGIALSDQLLEVNIQFSFWTHSGPCNHSEGGDDDGENMAVRTALTHAGSWL